MKAQTIELENGFYKRGFSIYKVYEPKKMVIEKDVLDFKETFKIQCDAIRDIKERQENIFIERNRLFKIDGDIELWT